ncbi:MAG: heavy metal translocating P-type ATPase [Gammaproteobacteria bacterium]
MPTHQFKIPGISCSACIEPIESVIRTYCGARLIDVHVNEFDKIATITLADSPVQYSQDKKDLTDCIESIGYACLDISKEATAPPESNEIDSVEEIKFPEPLYHSKTRKLKIFFKRLIHNPWFKGAIGLFGGAALLAVSILGFGIPAVTMGIIGAISSVVTLYLGKETYYKAAINFVKTKTVTMESLFTVSTMIAMGVSIAALFIPGLPMMFDAALLILGFKHIGKAIEETVKQKVNKQTFSSRAPREVLLECAVKTVAVNALRPGHIIIVRSGQTLPVDGICLDEKTSIYNTIITGRTLPQPVKKGELLLAGFKVPDDVAFIKMQVAATQADSYLEFLDVKMRQAEREKAPLVTTANKILRYFVPTIFAVALISAIVIGVVISPAAAIQCATSVLVAACPCTFGLVTPLAMKIGLAKAAENGVCFKSGKSLEKAKNINTVVFDLNGTLTTGIYRVTKSTIPQDMLAYLAAIERRARHPIAQAICQYIDAKHPAQLPVEISSLDTSDHSGIIANCTEGQFIVGNESMMTSHGIDVSEVKSNIKKYHAEHIVYFVHNKKLQGYVLLEDPLRKDAKATVKQLQAMGKEIHICTGADQYTANAYAKKLGISPQHVRANCVGEAKDLTANTKTAYIREFRTRNLKVAMIGDAGNDAAAIETSDVGFAIKSTAGDRITQQAAQAVVSKESLWPIVSGFAIASQTVRNIKQNLTLSLGYNMLSVLAFGGLLVGIGFMVNPALGAALMIFQTALILMNSQRFKRQSLPTMPRLTSSSQGKANEEWESTHRLSYKKLSQLEPVNRPTRTHGAIIKNSPIEEVSSTAKQEQALSRPVDYTRTRNLSGRGFG